MDLLPLVLTDAVLFFCGLLAVTGRLLFLFSLPLFLADGGVHSNSDAASQGKGTGRAGGQTRQTTILELSSPFPVRIKMAVFLFSQNTPHPKEAARFVKWAVHPVMFGSTVIPLINRRVAFAARLPDVPTLVTCCSGAIRPSPR